jgi:hypothetical protein
MKSFIEYLNEANPGATKYLARETVERDRGTKPNPKPKTEKNSLRGNPHIPEVK